MEMEMEMEMDKYINDLIEGRIKENQQRLV